MKETSKKKTKEKEIPSEKIENAEEVIQEDIEVQAESDISDEIITDDESHQELEEVDPKDNEIIELKERVTKLEEQLLREQAEMINFKRRMTDEKIKDRQFANQRILKDLLPLVDHIEMMLKNEKENEAFKHFEKTFNTLHENFLNVLSQHDCKPVEAVSKPFDPMLHEAVMKEPSKEHEPQTVLEEFQKGYTYKERLLRPSMVKVSE